MVVEYDLRTPASEKALISLIGPGAGMPCLLLLGINPLVVAISGVISFALIYGIQVIKEESSFTTLTYLDENDVERIRECLKAKEEETA